MLPFVKKQKDLRQNANCNLHVSVVFTIVLTVAFSCTYSPDAGSDTKGNDPKEHTVQERDTIASRNIIMSVDTDTWKNRSTRKSLATYRSPLKSKQISIIVIEKSVDSSSKYFQDVADECAKWILNAKDVVDIMRSCDEISGHEFHYFYDVIPCSYKGTLLLDGHEAQFELNGGSFGVLIFSDTSVYIGYRKRGSTHYFISSPADSLE